MIYYALIMTGLFALLFGFVCGYGLKTKKPTKHSVSSKGFSYSSNNNEEYRNFLNYNGSEQA